MGSYFLMTFWATDKREKAVSVRDADSKKSGEYLAFNKLQSTELEW